MKENIICVVYVYDTILAGPDASDYDTIVSLGIVDEEQRHSFEIRHEGEVGDFLEIRIEKSTSRASTLTQTGLIKKLLKECDMQVCNAAKTPSSTTSLGKDEDGEPLSDK